MRRADHGVRIAFGADVGDGAGILAAAFAQDPWFGWLYPQVEERAAMSEAWFELVLGRALSMGHSYRTAAGFVNWVPPDVHFPGPADIELAVDLLQRQIGERAATALGIIGEVGAVFPETPRFHCIYVGVQPRHQRGGDGEALMRRVLDVCDAEGIAASLTSTNDVNLGFYRRLGFEEIGAVPIADAGSVMRPMWREPQPLRPDGRS